MHACRNRAPLALGELTARVQPHAAPRSAVHRRSSHHQAPRWHGRARVHTAGDLPYAAQLHAVTHGEVPGGHWPLHAAHPQLRAQERRGRGQRSGHRRGHRHWCRRCRCSTGGRGRRRRCHRGGRVTALARRQCGRARWLGRIRRQQRHEVDADRSSTAAKNDCPVCALLDEPVLVVRPRLPRLFQGQATHRGNQVAAGRELLDEALRHLRCLARHGYGVEGCPPGIAVLQPICDGKANMREELRAAGRHGPLGMLHLPREEVYRHHGAAPRCNQARQHRREESRAASDIQDPRWPALPAECRVQELHKHHIDAQVLEDKAAHGEALHSAVPAEGTVHRLVPAGLGRPMPFQDPPVRWEVGAGESLFYLRVGLPTVLLRECGHLLAHLMRMGRLQAQLV
mmetsp:Transcript_104250/g.331481  ORF Transcript_104250/g.331481 Transcript_104250/m.331481 type:complete len:399 (+) Transcript_104250:35-1231(+)